MQIYVIISWNNDNKHRIQSCLAERSEFALSRKEKIKNTYYIERYIAR